MFNAVIHGKFPARGEHVPARTNELLSFIKAHRDAQPILRTKRDYECVALINKIRSIAYTQGIVPAPILSERTPVMQVVPVTEQNHFHDYKSAGRDKALHSIVKRQQRDVERERAKAAEARLNELAWQELNDTA